MRLSASRAVQRPREPCKNSRGGQSASKAHHEQDWNVTIGPWRGPQMVPKVTEGKYRCPVQFCERTGSPRALVAVQPTVRIRTNSRDDEKRRKWTNETRQAFHVAPSVSDGRAICSVHEDTSLAEGRDDYERWRLKTPSTFYLTICSPQLCGTYSPARSSPG